jgi:photosystem II stability/assembly factor-like uncharacterized protein
VRAAARGALVVLTASAVAGCRTGVPGPGTGPVMPTSALPILTPQTSGTTVLLQAVSAPSASVAWISGHQGTYVRTTDGGATWRVARVPGADTLQFRDVVALDADRAWLMSAGPGVLSRIYRTTDAGATWTLQFTNDEPEAFYDCIDFWDEHRGVAFSDQVSGRIIIRVTTDGGATWNLVPTSALPAALPGEGGFAASGTCLVTRPGGRAWIATGNAPRSRVLYTGDYGRSWDVFEMPVVAAGEAAGLATITFRDDRHGAALGGEIGKADARTDNVAVTADGGRTWRRGGRPVFAGAVFGAAFIPGAGPWLVAVGPGGADLSRDGGMTWTSIDTLSYWGIGFSPEGTGWIAGPSGRITRVAPR